MAAFALTNNAAERQLRRVAVGRKAWLFAGSDDRAQAANNLLTPLASIASNPSRPGRQDHGVQHPLRNRTG